MLPYPDEMCGPRGVKVNECCADEVEAFDDAIMEDEFEDGDPCVWRITIAEDAAVDGWLTFSVEKYKQVVTFNFQILFKK